MPKTKAESSSAAEAEETRVGDNPSTKQPGKKEPKIRQFERAVKCSAFYWDHSMAPMKDWVKGKVTGRGQRWRFLTSHGIKDVVAGCYHVLRDNGEVTVISKDRFEQEWTPCGRT